MNDHDATPIAGLDQVVARWQQFGHDLLVGLQRAEAGLNAWAEKIDIAAKRMSAGISDITAAHLVFLRPGFLPSVPLMKWIRNPTEIRSDEVALVYADILREDGIPAAAEAMEWLAEIAGLGHHEFTLRAIFPEIERIAREQTYEVGVMDGITSIPSLRSAINELILENVFGESVRIAGKIDFFVLTTISAFDFAYSSTSTKPSAPPKPEAVLFRHAFHKVPNRHRICHGHRIYYDHVHVVNGLTLLFVMAKIGSVMAEFGYRVPKSTDDQTEAFKKWRESRRRVNTRMSGIWQVLQGKSNPHSKQANNRSRDV